jgi:hypothetical protein
MSGMLCPASQRVVLESFRDKEGQKPRDKGHRDYADSNREERAKRERQRV